MCNFSFPEVIFLSNLVKSSYDDAMPRTKRVCPAGEVFHVLNRSVARLTIFEKPEDYDAFMRVVVETWQQIPLPIFAMVVMPNHWHFVVKPTDDQRRRVCCAHQLWVVILTR